MSENIVYEKSYSLALRIIKLYLFLSKEKREFVLSKQILRSGTAIGALISEAKFAQRNIVLVIVAQRYQPYYYGNI